MQLQNWIWLDETVAFNKGKDQDWPFPSEHVVVFSPMEQYKQEGNTHNDTSHAIKHLVEFKPEQVKTIAKSYSRFILANIRKTFLLSKTTGQTIKDPQTVEQQANNIYVILNTFDRINDKVMLSGEGSLNLYERYGFQQGCLQLKSSYLEIVGQLVSQAVDVNKTHNLDILKQIIGSKPFRFTVMVGGLNKTFIYDFKQQGLMIFRDTGELNTLFKLPKTKLKTYIKANGNPVNDNLLQAL